MGSLSPCFRGIIQVGIVGIGLLFAQQHAKPSPEGADQLFDAIQRTAAKSVRIFDISAGHSVPAGIGDDEQIGIGGRATERVAMDKLPVESKMFGGKPKCTPHILKNGVDHRGGARAGNDCFRPACCPCGNHDWRTAVRENATPGSES